MRPRPEVSAIRPTITVISNPRLPPIIMGGCEIVDAAWHDGGSPSLEVSGSFLVNAAKDGSSMAIVTCAQHTGAKDDGPRHTSPQVVLRSSQKLTIWTNREK